MVQGPEHHLGATHQVQQVVLNDVVHVDGEGVVGGRLPLADIGELADGPGQAYVGRGQKVSQLQGRMGMVVKKMRV